MKQTESAETAAWLKEKPPLKQLCSRFPAQWDVVQHEIATVLSTGKPEDLQLYLKRLSPITSPPCKKTYPATDIQNAQEALVLQMVMHQMAHAAVKMHCVAVASGVESGSVRFNLLNGIIAQKLLFEDGLIRKPVSLFWFRLFWPLVWQKRFLMPLVQPEGIYCFYTRELMQELTKIINGRSCLEIAAGDGTLTRFLGNNGVQITATDDYSWNHSIRYPEWVVKADAKEALRNYAPEVVICSWPPAQNSFERQVFVTKRVQLYIVIGSRHRFAAGNWEEYQRQTFFNYEEDSRLSRLVVPRELDAAVFIFRRIKS